MKLLYNLFLSICTFGITLANSGDFEFNASEVNAKFEKLNRIEQIHKANPDLSLEQITSAEEFQGISISKNSVSMHSMAGDLPLLPAFWWGCILGVIGILIVYLITEDSDQVTKALYGCIVQQIIGTLYVVAFLLFWAW